MKPRHGSMEGGRRRGVRRWFPGGCSLTSPVACRRSWSISPRRQNGADLRQRPVYLADSSGFGLPVLAEDAQQQGQCPALRLRKLSPRSWSPPAGTRRTAAGLHRRTGGSRWRHHFLLATDRYRMALKELTWNPSSTQISATRSGPSQGAERDSTLHDCGEEVTLSLSDGGGGDGIIGFEGHGASGERQNNDPIAGRGVSQSPPHHEHACTR